MLVTVIVIMVPVVIVMMMVVISAHTIRMVIPAHVQDQTGRIMADRVHERAVEMEPIRRCRLVTYVRKKKKKGVCCRSENSKRLPGIII